MSNEYLYKNKQNNRTSRLRLISYGMEKNLAFTVIEIIIVFSIIGILGIFVFSITKDAQQKNRDAERLKEFQSLRNDLAFYYKNNGYYPSGTESDLTKYIANIHVGIKYQSTNASNTEMCKISCPSYHLGIILERFDNDVLFADKNNMVGFNGFSKDCGSIKSEYDYCYDVTQ